MRKLSGILIVSLVVALLAWPAVACAAPPLTLDSGQVTDDAGVLGPDTSRVESALDQLNETYSVQLFLVFVDSFDGMDSQEWADETAVINGLGLNDILLAVAVGDRQYAWSVDQDFPLTDVQLDAAAANFIEPKLQQSDWAGAGIVAAEAYGNELAATAVPVTTSAETTSGSGISPLGCIVPIALIVIVAAIAGFFVSKRRGKKPSGAAGSAAPLDMKSLETKAGKVLVDVDDALRESEAELGFAEAEFGSEAVEEYSSALAESKKEVVEAFRIQQSVYDAEPEDESTRRQMLERIVQLAESADARLDEKAEAFAGLRDLSKRVDDVLAATTKRLDAAEASLPAQAETLAALKKMYLTTALGEVADDDTEAAGLVEFARKAIAEGSEKSAAGDKNAAAISARAAEDAVAQIEGLVQAVAGAKTSLDQARADLEREVPLLEQAAAEAESKSAAELTNLAASAREVVAAAKDALAAPTLDPIAMLSRVREVAVAIQNALGNAKQAADAAQAAIRSAHDRIASIESYIQSRRIAVGAEARSALTEAKIRVARAEQALSSDPATALSEAQSAGQYADSATRYAQGDVASYQRSTNPPAPSGTTSRAAGMMGGAVLGSVTRGMSSGGGSSSSRRSSSSSFGGSSRRSSGSSSAGSRSSGGRRGGGGRF